MSSIKLKPIFWVKMVEFMQLFFLFMSMNGGPAQSYKIGRRTHPLGSRMCVWRDLKRNMWFFFCHLVGRLSLKSYIPLSLPALSGFRGRGVAGGITHKHSSVKSSLHYSNARYIICMQNSQGISQTSPKQPQIPIRVSDHSAESASSRVVFTCPLKLLGLWDMAAPTESLIITHRRARAGSAHRYWAVGWLTGEDQHMCMHS